ncbi:helix-turn-helix domain-containing protein [Vibrio cholerae]|uniref:helix-turn-helix domain-containing protein n=1 Tax=Vibrio cholerae TaxID=666 RepID=UPI00406C9B93
MDLDVLDKLCDLFNCSLSDILKIMLNNGKSRDFESEISSEIESLSKLKASIIYSASKGEL